jgi:hypothetical protein
MRHVREVWGEAGTWQQSPEGTQHGPSGMQQLQLKVAVKVLLLGSESRGIKAVVSRHHSFEI